MRALIEKRIKSLEKYAYENLVPVPDALKLMDEILTFCQTKKHEPWSAELAALVEYFAAPLRARDLKTFHERANEAKRNLREAIM